MVEKLRERIRQARSDSSLSSLQVAATTLTAVTMSVVSTRLTGVVNSVLLVGLVSVASAFASEFYRTAILVSSPALKEHHEEVLEKREEERQEVEQERRKHRQEREEKVQGYPLQRSRKEENARKSRRYTLLTIFQRSPALQMSALFAGVALLTVGVSYGVAKAQADEVVYQTTISQSGLSDAEKEELLESAKASAEDATDKKLSHEEKAAPLTVEELQTQVAALQDKVEALESSTTTGDSRGSSGSQDTAALLQQIDDLSAALDEQQEANAKLTQRVQTLEKQLGEGRSTPSPESLEITPNE